MKDLIGADIYKEPRKVSEPFCLRSAMTPNVREFSEPSIIEIMSEFFLEGEIDDKNKK